MNNKISVVYIGSKEKKKDTLTGSRLVFPRHTPVAVEQDIAYQLLEYSSVWIEEAQLADHLKRVDEQARALTRAAVLQEQIDQAAQSAASLVVEINGESMDLEKLNSAKLKTLIAAHEFDVAPKGAQEDVADFRLRVRDHVRSLAEAGEAPVMGLGNVPDVITTDPEQ